MASEDHATRKARREKEIEALQAEAESMKAQAAANLKQLDEIDAAWRARIAAHGMSADEVLALADATGASDVVAYHHRKRAEENRPAPQPRKKARRARVNA